MARLPYLTRDDLPEADRAIFDNLVEERKTPVGNIFRILAHTPNLLRRFLALGGELRNGTALDPKLRELALVTVGRLTGADYEFTHHWNLARRVGVSREQLEHLADFETSPLFNDTERIVMRYALEATFEALRKALDTRRLMEVIQNVAFYNMVVRILVPLGVEVEAGVKKM
jgi:AhpD family alkylhydroperoxidase